MNVHCPACNALMRDGGKCPRCGHWDEGDCECRFCLALQQEEEDENE